MKKLLNLLMILFFVGALTACGGETAEAESPAEDPVEQVEEPEVTEPDTSATAPEETVNEEESSEEESSEGGH